MAWLRSTVVNARNEFALASMAEVRTEDTHCHHGPLNQLGVPSASLIFSRPAATKLPTPLSMVTAEDDVPFFQLLRGLYHDSKG